MNINTIEEQIDIRAALKEQIELLNKRLKQINIDLLANLDAAGLKKAITPLGNKVVVIEQEITAINADLLRDRLTPAQWNKVTERVLNEVLLDAMVTTGKVDATVVDECTYIAAEKRFLR